MTVYEHWTFACEPGRLEALVEHLGKQGRSEIEAAGGRVLGIFKPLIGLSLNHAVVIAEWPGSDTPFSAHHVLSAACHGTSIEVHDLWEATLRPAPGAVLPHLHGLYTHRWFDIDAARHQEFLDHSGAAWGNFETAHEAKVIGLWRARNAPAPGRIRMRLMAWYRDLGVWESSRFFNAKPQAAEANARLGARYQMTLDSAVAILQRLQ
jgi:hypothetical protein